MLYYYLPSSFFNLHSLGIISFFFYLSPLCRDICVFEHWITWHWSEDSTRKTSQGTFSQKKENAAQEATMVPVGPKINLASCSEPQDFRQSWEEDVDSRTRNCSWSPNFGPQSWKDWRLQLRLGFSRGDPGNSTWIRSDWIWTYDSKIGISSNEIDHGVKKTHWPKNLAARSVLWLHVWLGTFKV